MIRFVFRSLGLVVLAAAFVAFVYDGTRSIADGAITTSAPIDIWSYVHPQSLEQAQEVVERESLPWVWDPAIMTVLTAPTALVFGIFGALLVLLGRPPRPKIGYSRR